MSRIKSYINNYYNNFNASEEKVFFISESENEHFTPIWFMRQAGRYLPEYLLVRKQYDNFLQFIYDPLAASIVTLQPVWRFGLDAAIIFSDILTTLDMVGFDVKFKNNVGPVINLSPDKTNDELSVKYKIDKISELLSNNLDDEKGKKKLQALKQSIQLTRLGIDSVCSFAKNKAGNNKKPEHNKNKNQPINNWMDKDSHAQYLANVVSAFDKTNYDSKITTKITDANILKQLADIQSDWCSRDEYKELQTANLKINSKTKSYLKQSPSLIGFVGAPFTLMCYAFSGSYEKEWPSIRKLMAIVKYDAKIKQTLDRIISRLVELQTQYAINQLEAGADIIKIFESWALALHPDDFVEYCYNPVNQLVYNIKKYIDEHAIKNLDKSSVIVFFRGHSKLWSEQLGKLNSRKKAEVYAMDWSVDIDKCYQNMAGNNSSFMLQGGMDPVNVAISDQDDFSSSTEYEVGVKNANSRRLKLLIGQFMKDLEKHQKKHNQSSNYIFNFGHGLSPLSKPGDVAKVVSYIRSY